MATETEGTFQAGDASLYTKTWTPTGPIRAKLILVHGFSDHVNWYNEMLHELATHGIQTFGFDQRGWGRSVKKPSDKGLTGPTSQVIADIVAFIQDKLPSTEPLFVMGHSMGGGEVLTLAGDPQYEGVVSQVRGWLLEAPFVGFAPQENPSSLKIAAGRLAGRLLPRFQLRHVIPADNITRDKEVAKGMTDDPLCHDTGTLEGLASLLDRTAALAAGNVTLGKQVRGLWLGHGDNDKTCSYDVAIKFAEQQAIEDKTIKTYKGGYHALHVDLVKAEFTKDVVDWILERSQPAPVEAKL
ncbi:Alpha/Beta hydrolase protein [Ilyonectria robusta]|uniref:Alpha/Beta hydrolase protein n=1 Tax=Ilyonectria robusta TaxID=1079257 RepID=UPI001E8EA714|nr:Alpha/Beta hydrolase protein [Ilyonectria robusta]KAH8661298.1 Alpha/Beta hydrolase protein [Ilyonectria robusta]